MAHGERHRMLKFIVSKLISHFSISFVLYLSMFTKALWAIIYITVFYESVEKK